MDVSINGQFVRTIRLRGDEPEFAYSYGVFETIRTYDRKPFALVQHLRRLHQSAAALHLPIAYSTATIKRWVLQHCTNQPDQRIKIIAAPQRIYILSQPLVIAPTVYHGVAVQLRQVARSTPQVKSIAYGVEFQAHTAAQAAGYYDALIMNRQQQILELAYANFFCVRRNTIITPARNILFGVTRAIVIQLARRHYRLQFRSLAKTAALTADECFLTQTSTGIVPIVRINRQRIGNGTPGPVTTHLMTLFKEYVAEE